MTSGENSKKKNNWCTMFDIVDSKIFMGVWNKNDWWSLNAFSYYVTQKLLIQEKKCGYNPL